MDAPHDIPPAPEPDGEPLPAADLVPQVYEHLRDLARRRIADEPKGQSLDPTGLVHEALLRITTTEGRTWNGHRHFFAAAARAMRRILVERARARASLKRGGDRRRVSLDQADHATADSQDSVDWVAVEEAMEALAALDPGLAEAVNLRYFAGLTVPEVAQALGRSPRSIDRDWNVARAWLGSRLDLQDPP